MKLRKLFSNIISGVLVLSLSQSLEAQSLSTGLVMSDLVYKNIGIQFSARPHKYFLLNTFAQWRPKADRTLFLLIASETTSETGYVLELNPALRLQLGKENNKWGEFFIGPYGQIKKFKGTDRGVAIGVSSRTGITDRHFTVLGCTSGLNFILDKNLLIGAQCGLGKLAKDLRNGNTNETEVEASGGSLPPSDLLYARATIAFVF